MFRRLAGQYVVDLPLAADDIITLAAAHGWLPGPAHTALARPAWWRHHDTGWASTWLQIATQARAHSADALTGITKAALTGSVQHVTTSFRTQRYQQVAVLALLGCHDAGQPAPVGLLDQLAEQAHPAWRPARPTCCSPSSTSSGSDPSPTPRTWLGGSCQEWNSRSTRLSHF